MSKQTFYPTVDANPDFVKLEEEVLAFWKRENIFEASVEQRPKAIAGESNEYIFYDGPPFANGLPHYGHLLTGYVKDMVARFWTMKGKRVERRFGWDCHGLPAEMAAEKALNISGRAAIMEYGIDKFNDHCRESVMTFASEWERYVDRQGRWVDFQNDYKTMDRDFMESVLWAFKQLFDKGLIYESSRVMAYSWAAETPLSNFETKLDNAYRDKEDKAIYVAFKLKDKPRGAPEADSYYLVGWTTTPWTLPSNLALAVAEEMAYEARVYNGVCEIMQHAGWQALEKERPAPTGGVDRLDGSAEDLECEYKTTFLRGSELIGLTYEPLFPYFKDTENAFRVLDGSSFIEEGSGTGVVHMAPGFGEDDQRVCAENGIETIVPVDEKGRYTDEIFDIEGLSLKGLNVIKETRKDESDPFNEKQVEKYGLANLRIIQHLKQTGQLIKQEDYKHPYPHCWRTDEPIIYRALPSWYVKVTDYKDRAVKHNQNINWIPNHVRDGAMGHMLDSAPDWSISRNRFWGCPIPVWKSESGKLLVFGSIAELEAASGQKVEDLHRPFIDELVIEKDGETYTRVSEVLDCWFESGSMPFAQLHYPFENEEKFKANFPGDFITEYIGQTRGWFNTLIMLSTALFDKEPFENCICHGVVLDEETGLKYSKRLKNYKDPMEVFDAFGADALRWMMLSSPVMRGADIGVDPEGAFIRDVVRLHIKPIWNAYNFFTLYANADGIQAEFSTDSGNMMDQYILSKCKDAIDRINQSMTAYDAPGATQAITAFFEVLNNWYIRRNRTRFWKEEQDADKQSAYNTLYTVITSMCRAAAPLLPFTTEAVYQGLTGEKSVHLTEFPTELADYAPASAHVMSDMDRVRDICNAGLSIRNKDNIRIRQPLATMTYYGAPLVESQDYYASLVADELNVKDVVFSDALDEVAERSLTINFPVAGKRLGPKMKEIAGAAKQGNWSVEGDTIICGGEALQEGEAVMQLKPKGDSAAAPLSTNDALVVLDTELTPELLSEGIARDVVRLVQQSRKEADLNVSDRIELVITGAEPVTQAVGAYQSYIAEQVLAKSVKTDNGAGEFTFEHQLEGAPVKISFSKAAA